MHDAAEAQRVVPRVLELFDDGTSTSFGSTRLLDRDSVSPVLRGRLGSFVVGAATDGAHQTSGGMGFAKEAHVERYFREARLLRLAPVSQEMTLNHLAQKVLQLPRSYQRCCSMPRHLDTEVAP